MVMGDGLIGQMMEPVEFADRPEPIRPLAPKDWATTGCKGRGPNIVNSLYLNPNELESLNDRLQKKYREMTEKEIRYAEYGTDRDYDLLICAYGTVARVGLTALEELEEKGVRIGLFRPISLQPFPYEQLRERALKAKHVLVTELSAGQMIEDVKLALRGEVPIHFHGRTGGNLISPEDVMKVAEEILGKGGGQ
jgi:2-oxoglutarate ferredoxin oxidoreductase subunit alpha